MFEETKKRLAERQDAAKKKDEEAKQKAEDVRRKAAEEAKRKAEEDAAHFQNASNEARLEADAIYARVMYQHGYTNLLSPNGLEWVRTQYL